MSYQSLYRRYRPRRFDEVRGQEHVVGALRNAVDNNSVTHAYLFSGPRGTGKTSTARILAKALNCENLQKGEPCCDCTPCQDMEAGRSFDLFELDAASNNGVDAIRDLIERTAVGSPGRTKVYILDEVHMLSPAASNALLKTLEEPPGHVRFVLATTDPQKVLPTIRSRTQHFEFQLLSADELERYVRWVIADADLDVDDEGVAWAVRQGRGSARDTLSALDQVVAAGGVVERTEPIEKLFEALVVKDSGVAILAVAEALAQGHDPRVLAKVFLDALRDTFLLSLGAEVPHMMAEDADRMGNWARQIGTPLLTRAMESIGSATVDMRQAADPRVPLEVALVRLTTSGAGSIAELSDRVEKLERALATGATVQPAGAATPADVDQKTDHSDQAQSGAAEASANVAQASEGLSPAAKARAELARLTQQHGEKSAPEPRARRAASKASSSNGPPPVPPSSRPKSSEPVESQAQSPADVAGPAVAESRENSPADASDRDAAPEPPSGPAAEAPTAPTAPPAGSELSLDDLTAAMESVVLGNVRGVTKAIYSQGHFASVTGDQAVFVVENAPTRERAEKSRAEIESLLSAHFGRAVSLMLTEKDSAGPGGGKSASPPTDHRGPETSRRPGSPELSAGETDEDPLVEPAHFDEEEELLTIDVNQLEDAKGIAETGLDRLMSAFPGATLMEANEEQR